MTAVEGTAFDKMCRVPSAVLGTATQPPFPADVLVTKCSWGCWDKEDEVCHKGLGESKCAEIYGHVDWLQKCDCRQTLKGPQGGAVATGRSELLQASARNYFSIPAFVVLFRESLEVTILLVIMLQFLQKAHDDGSIDDKVFETFRREVWLGTSMGGLLSLVIGVSVLILASFLYDDVFEGNGELIFEGIVTLLASAILTYIAFSFYRLLVKKEECEKELGLKVQDALNALDSRSNMPSLKTFASKRAFFVLAFTTGLREGMESIIFLVSVVPDLRDLWSLPLPIVCALFLSRLVGFCFFKGTHKLALGRFTKGCSAFLMLIAAGLLMSSAHKFQEVAFFGPWSPRSARLWGNRQLWDWSETANDKSNRFFVLLRALFGYQDRPTPVELSTYALYWAVTIPVALGFAMRASKTAVTEAAGDPIDESKEVRASESTTGSGSRSVSVLSTDAGADEQVAV